MEELFTGNKIMLYIVSVFYILNIDKLKVNQKMIVLYLFTYLIKIFNILDIKLIIPILLISTFIYLEFLIKDSVKQKMLDNTFGRLIDYFYQMIFLYNLLSFVISMTLITNYITELVTDNFIQKILLIISILILIKNIINLSCFNYSINDFTEIKMKMDNIKLKIDYSSNSKLLKFYQILAMYEDKSYFIRKNNYNFLCIDFLLYRYFKIGINSDDDNRKRKNIKIIKLRKIPIIIIKLFIDLTKLLKLRRGYSTLEMQLIRTLGVREGYKKIFKRKIYEVIYSTIFFKYLKKYYSNLYVDDTKYKEYLLYIYFYIAPVFLNNKKYKNIFSMWGKEELEDCTDEEIFIGVLSLSNKLSNFNNIYNYTEIIKNFNLNQKEIINKLFALKN